MFYRRVLTAIDRGGWTHSERSALYELEKRWRPRALGQDPRFMLAGTQGGRLPRDLERRIKTLEQTHRSVT